MARMKSHEQRLLALIRKWSMVTACVATDESFARELDWPPSRVQAVLKRLHAKRFVLVKTSDPTRTPEGGFRTFRTIYLVAGLDDDAGALRVANVVRRSARDKPVTRKALCGICRCTPDELARWLERAAALRYLAVTPSWHQHVICSVVGQFLRKRVPNERVSTSGSFHDENYPEDLRALLFEMVDSKLQVIPPPFPTTFCLPLTNKEVASKLRVSPSYASELVSAEVERRTLFVLGTGKHRILSRRPLPSPAEGARDRVLGLLASGPITLAEARGAMPQGRSTERDVWAQLEALGVRRVRFGNEHVVYRHQLPAEFLAARDERRREAKRRSNKRTQRSRRERERDERVRTEFMEEVVAKAGVFASEYGVTSPTLDYQEVMGLWRSKAAHGATRDHAVVEVAATFVNRHIDEVDPDLWSRLAQATQHAGTTETLAQ
jgi:hypothetical protein